MIIYLVKSTLLLALLLVLYKVLLENEKMHQFNRFFLLAALVLGLTAPLIQVNFSPYTTIAGVEISKFESTVNAPSDFVAKSIEPIISDAPAPISTPDAEGEGVTPIQSQPEKPLFSRLQILFFIYGLITLFFLIRFGAGLFELFSKVRLGTKSTFKSSTLILLDEKITPQSFLKWIFLNKTDFESGKINPEILEHELTHIRQKHSFDVLLIEFLKTVFWFNPVLYFYKHAIQLNHEFLADEGAINSSEDAQNYQSILLDFTSDANSKKLTSSLNFSLTKRRLALIGKTSSVSQLYFKFLPVLIAFTFSPFMFFDQREKSPETFAITHEEYWANQIYSDVSLEFQGFPYGEDTVDLFRPIPSLAFLDGKPFSGVENIFDKETDYLKVSNIYVDGLPINQKTFDPDGTYSASIDFFYNAQKTKRYSTRYYQLGELRSETIFSSPEHNGKRIYKGWNSNGYLETIMIFESNRSGPKIDEMIRYDAEGNVMFHERRKNGELVEKIK